VRSKSQLLGAVWGWEEYDLNVVEVHVSALRRKLGEPRVIHTVRGQGYVARAEVTAEAPSP
jgi:DNA-binding response OmpR family regulator